MKNIIIIVLILIVLGLGGYLFTRSTVTDDSATSTADVTETTDTTNVLGVDKTDVMTDEKSETVIGASSEGRDIVAYHFGTGADEVLFVGGIHGGYSWNTSLVAFDAIKYLRANPSVIPQNLTVTIVPVLNPDGLYKVTGKEGEFIASDVTVSQDIQIAGRFNAREVDLNRNFDCTWKATGTWQNKPVSGGAQAFSEPESQAIKAYAEATKLKAVVVWYSAAGGVYSSSCERGILPITQSLTTVFAKASGYPAHESFDFYETSGDMANWFAKINTPAISVLLTNHTDTEWDKNQKGIDAVLKALAK